MNMRPCLSMETQPVSFSILGDGEGTRSSNSESYLSWASSCPSALVDSTPQGPRPTRCLRLCAGHGCTSPLHASSRYLLSIFFILISQGMKMTTKLQAKRANFLQSYTGEAVVRNPLIHNLGNGVLGRGKDPIHTHRTLNYGFSGH